MNEPQERCEPRQSARDSRHCFEVLLAKLELLDLPGGCHGELRYESDGSRHLERRQTFATPRDQLVIRCVLPIRARFTFTDGTTAEYSYPVDVWIHGARYTRTYALGGKQIARIELDPDHRLIDIDRKNNVWAAGGTLSSTQP